MKIDQIILMHNHHPLSWVGSAIFTNLFTQNQLQIRRKYFDLYGEYAESTYAYVENFQI